MDAFTTIMVVSINSINRNPRELESVGLCFWLIGLSGEDREGSEMISI